MSHTIYCNYIILNTHVLKDIRIFILKDSTLVIHKKNNNMYLNDNVDFRVISDESFVCYNFEGNE